MPATRSKHSPLFWLFVAVFIATGGALWTGWGSGPHGEVTTGTKVGVFLFVVAGWLVSLCLHEYAHETSAWYVSAGRDGITRPTLDPLRVGGVNLPT